MAAGCWQRRTDLLMICCVGLPLDKSVKYVTGLQIGCWQRCEETRGDRSSGRGLVGSVELLGVHFFEPHKTPPAMMQIIET